MFKGGNSKEVNDQPNKLNRFVEGTNIKGDIVSESNIRIDGELVGNLTTTGKLVIGPTGKVTGNIVCSNADIEGAINGTIKVDGLLSLKATAVLTGDINTHKIEVHNGADFKGTCNMTAETSQEFTSKITTEQESELVY